MDTKTIENRMSELHERKMVWRDNYFMSHEFDEEDALKKFLKAVMDYEEAKARHNRKSYQAGTYPERLSPVFRKPIKHPDQLLETAADDVGEVDMVNHPPHYTNGDGVECIDAIRSALGKEGFMAFLQGQILKYSWRCQLKGKPTEDLLKAEFYNSRLRKEIEESDN